MYSYSHTSRLAVKKGLVDRHNLALFNRRAQGAFRGEAKQASQQGGEAAEHSRN